MKNFTFISVAFSSMVFFFRCCDHTGILDVEMLFPCLPTRAPHKCVFQHKQAHTHTHHYSFFLFSTHFHY